MSAPDRTPEEVLASLVANALYGEGAGDFYAATGWTVRHESEEVARALLAAGYQLVPPGHHVVPAERAEPVRCDGSGWVRVAFSDGSSPRLRCPGCPDCKPPEPVRCDGSGWLDEWLYLGDKPVSRERCPSCDGAGCKDDQTRADLDADIRRAGFDGYHGCPHIGPDAGCPTPFMCSERGNCPDRKGAVIDPPEPPAHLRQKETP